MPKKIFWPASLVVMGLVLIAANMGYFPSEFMPLWPITMIVLGLAGLLTADRQEWLVKDSELKKAKTTKPTAARRRK
jgi:hypothetical protein